MSGYRSPLTERYASVPMDLLFDQNKRYAIWRELWIALAQAQQRAGLPITDGQIQELEDTKGNFQWDRISAYEAEMRHDVMAHIKAWADLCPEGGKIIHLGATSCFVTDNSDIILYRQALLLIHGHLIGVLTLLRDFIEEHRDKPTLGYTHFQPAQPTTVSRRAVSWANDFLRVADRIVEFIENMQLRGVRGAVGTQASMHTLFDGDQSAVANINYHLQHCLMFQAVDPNGMICNQTYSRIEDSILSKELSLVAEVASKFAHDIRLLSHTGEVVEAKDGGQVGSSAMPFKCNPIISERICSLSRFVISNASSMATTYATQWLERSLDDSAVRRIVIPELFLAVDGVLLSVLSVLDKLKVDDVAIARKLDEQRAQLAMEDEMMESVLLGHSRQEEHQRLMLQGKTATRPINTGFASEQVKRFLCDLGDGIDHHQRYNKGFDGVQVIRNDYQRTS